MSTATQTPVEIDTALAELYAEEQRARMTYDRITDSLSTGVYTRYTEEDMDDAAEALHAIIEKELPLEAEYERRPWQRYWHVTNANGHIHRSQSCSSCFPDTQYFWRTDLSGLTDVEVVEREAYNACSVCMPIAPAEQKAARERYTREQREGRKAEKDAKKAAKAEKALVRARKHAEKVEQAIKDTTGEGEIHEALIIFRRDYSLYGHDGLKSIYEASYDLPAQVADTLYALKEAQESFATRPLRNLSEAVKIALSERGLI